MGFMAREGLYVFFIGKVSLSAISTQVNSNFLRNASLQFVKL